MKMNRYIVKSFNRYLVESLNGETNALNIAVAKPLQRFNGFQQCNEP